MSKPSPESYYERLDENGGLGLIGWSDGHSVSADSITQALNDNCKYFYDIQMRSITFILCCATPLVEHDRFRLLLQYGIDG